MDAPRSPLDRLIAIVGASLLGDRQKAVARLRDHAASAAAVRAQRCEEGLPAPPLAFLSLTSPGAFARCDCATSLHGWSIDVPVPLLNLILAEVERSGVFFCVLTGRGRWIDEDLIDVLRGRDRQLFLLCARPEDLGEGVAERLAALPHVLPLLETRKAGAGCCDGYPDPATRGAIDALRSGRVPYGFAVTASEGNLPHLMGLEFYNECLLENAAFGLIVDCLQIPSCGDACRPVRPADRAALGRHVGDLRGRLGGFFAYFPWDLAGGGWCLAAPHAAGAASAFTLLHVAPSHLGEGELAPPGALLFESLRISPLAERGRPVGRRDRATARIHADSVVGGAVG